MFLLMLTDVFSYVQTALNWQGVFVVGWVGVVVTHFALNARDRAFGPKVDDDRLPKLGWGLIAWIVPSIVGVILLESSTVPAIWNQSAQLVVLFASVILYAIGHFVASDRVDDDRPSVEAGV